MTDTNLYQSPNVEKNIRTAVVSSERDEIQIHQHRMRRTIRRIVYTRELNPACLSPSSHAVMSSERDEIQIHQHRMRRTIRRIVYIWELNPARLSPSSHAVVSSERDDLNSCTPISFDEKYARQFKLHAFYFSVQLFVDYCAYIEVSRGCSTLNLRAYLFQDCKLVDVAEVRGRHVVEHPA